MTWEPAGAERGRVCPLCRAPFTPARQRGRPPKYCPPCRELRDRRDGRPRRPRGPQRVRDVDATTRAAAERIVADWTPVPYRHPAPGRIDVVEPAPRDEQGRVLCRGCGHPINPWWGSCGCDPGFLDDAGRPLDARYGPGGELEGRFDGDQGHRTKGPTMSELPGVETKESGAADAERKEAPPLRAEDERVAGDGESDAGDGSGN